MKKNSRIVEDIDETLLLNSIAEPGIVKEAPKPAAGAVSEENTAPSPLPATESFQAESREQLSKQEMFVPAEETRPENLSKLEKQQKYESLFIRESDMPPARFGKSVYIRKEYHDRISQIISVTGINEVSIFGYIDNVLTHHFESFRDEMVRYFKKNSFFK